MAMYEIMKEEAILGPFNINDIEEFVRTGLILKKDYVYAIDFPDTFMTVGELLAHSGRKVSVEHKGNLFKQLKDIGSELILPQITFTKEPWKDSRLLMLALVGLSLSVIIAMAPFLPPFAIFYVVSLYFATVWGLYFYYLFKTEQVKFKQTILLFFETQLFIMIVYGLLLSGGSGIRDVLITSENPLVGMVTCIVGIGMLEETVKALPVLLILLITKFVTKPQTAVFYGLISGLAFGVYEGVEYQMGANFQMLFEISPEDGYTYAYLSNIARMTSLPFLHAIWCGIASYFMAFAFLYPRYRVSLILLAILIPATIHGLYDWFCFNVTSTLVSLPLTVVGVVLLKVYLSIDYDFHSKLAD